MAFRIVLLALSSLACVSVGGEGEIDPLEDSSRQRAMVDSIARVLAEPMRARSAEQALLLEMDALYAPLDADQRRFMDAIRALEGGDPALGVATGVDWVRLTDQRVTGAAGEHALGLQLLPPEAAAALRAMNAAMRSELGRSLLVGSGYRSPANQLFVFVTYLPHYDYSVARTMPHVSLPGASDHNRVERQGIDFVSERGVDLRYSDAPAFTALAEYAWLEDRAAEFGFERDGPDTRSPWHWRWRGTAASGGR